MWLFGKPHDEKGDADDSATSEEPSNQARETLSRNIGEPEIKIPAEDYYSVENALSPEGQVRATLYSWSEAWNHGDLATYLNGYAYDARYVSESLAQTGTSSEMVVTGKEAIDKLFTDVFDHAKAYQAKRKKKKGVAGLIVYSDIDVRMIGDENAIVFGHYRLERSPAAADSGVFTLHVAMIEGEWRIQSEHSSNVPKVKPLSNRELPQTGTVEDTWPHI